MTNNTALPLAGVRVVDFGQQIAGPAVAMVLADLGATVVHVDPPQGPQWDHPANAVLNRNKLCLRLDMKTEDGLAQARQLIDQADVVIESFRPGKLAKLGIDFEALRAQRPELVTLSMPGFASNDTLRREWKATEAIVAATSGAFTDMGFNRVLMVLDPSFSPLPLGSAYATTLAASSVVMALVGREKSGRGDAIEVPVAAALMEGLSYNSVVIEGMPERYFTMREHEIAHRKENGIKFDLNYEDLQEYLDPFYRTYKCKDGRYFYMVCPSHRNHARRALQALGIYEELLAEGLKVLDLTNVIAGPHSAAFIGRFGAEVIKLDPVKPLYDPLIGTLFTFQTNMGKQSALVDITTDEGREAFNRLVRSVDLVVINAPERQMKPLGLDHESLQAINPGVLFCRLDCLGGPRVGPKTNYIGYDDIIQANSGIMSRFGGPDTPEEHAHLGTLDVNCGFAGGLGMAVSIYHKMKTGEVTRSRTSLSAITNLAQIKFAFDYEGRAPFDEASGREALGNHALAHFYQAEDGWLFIDSDESELAKLASIEGLAGVVEAQDRAAFLRQAFSTAPAAYWVDALHAADIAAALPLGIEKLRDDYTRKADGTVGIDRGSYAFSVYEDHPSGHRVTLIDHYSIRPQEAPIYALRSTEAFGTSTRQVLEGVGYDAGEVESMIERGIAGTGWGREFLPS